MADGIDLGIDGLGEYREIGRGGFSTVYSARQVAFNRLVAVKVLDALDDAGLRRFHREQLSMGTVDQHPNVVTPFNAGYTRPDNKPYLVMEYMAGGSLQQRLDQTGPVGIDEAIDLVLPIAEALGHTHSSGIVHKDVKPANILISASGLVKLTDFGIAALQEATVTAAVAFSLAYSPPETFGVSPQNGSGDPRDERSDLYSLAATLYMLISGRDPFGDPTNSSPAGYMVRILNQPVPSVGHVALDAFLATAMAKDPADRYPTASQFIDALQAAKRNQRPTAETQAAEPPAAVQIPSIPDDAASDRPDLLLSPPDPEGRVEPEHSIHSAEAPIAPTSSPAFQRERPTESLQSEHSADITEVSREDLIRPLYSSHERAVGSPLSVQGQQRPPDQRKRTRVILGAIMMLTVVAVPLAVWVATRAPETERTTDQTIAAVPSTADIVGPVSASAGSKFALLTFTDPSSSSDDYEVSINGEEWQPLPEEGRIGDLENGQRYTFRVRLVTADGPGPPSAESNEVIPYGRPARPDVDVTYATSMIRWTWDEPSGNGRKITGYQVEIDGIAQPFQESRSFSYPEVFNPLEVIDIAVFAVSDGEDDDRSVSVGARSSFTVPGSITVVFTQATAATGAGDVGFVDEGKTLTAQLSSSEDVSNSDAWVWCGWDDDEYISYTWYINLLVEGNEILLTLAEELRYEPSGASLASEACASNLEASSVADNFTEHRFPIGNAVHEIPDRTIEGGGSSGSGTGAILEITATFEG